MPKSSYWLLLAALVGCSTTTVSPDTGSNTHNATNDLSGSDQTTGSDTTTRPDATVEVTLPPVVDQAGVAYVANYDGTELFFFRTDGDKAQAAGSIDLGAATHNLELDPYNDLLFVVSHEAKTITLFQLTRPGSQLAPPKKVATISPEMLPMFARVNPQRQRLYVVAALDDGSAETEFQLLAYDISDPPNPKPLRNSPFKVPATSALTLDSAREVLFVAGLLDNKIYAFDLRGDTVQRLPGDPVDLPKLYPQEHQTAFSVRSLAVDIFRNRLYATRRQSVLSELIVLDYPAARITAHSDFTPVADPFEVDKDIEQRKTIYDAHVPMVDLERGDVFLTAGGWQDMYVYGLLVAITKDLAFGAGCSDYDGFGCWLRSAAGQPLPTDGAGCIDYTHRTVVATSFVADRSTDRIAGYVNMFRYDDALALTPLPAEAGGDLTAGSRPITAVCY